MSEVGLQKKTNCIMTITLIMMLVEIYYGIISHSMALTADGFHMGTHVLAFGITLLASLLVVKYPDKNKKFNALGGFTSAILLGFTSLGIIVESFEKFFKPLEISFEEAVLVAVIGLIVNLVCIFIMGSNTHHSHCNEEHHEHENLNFKAAYLHILSDILTSVLAIAALLAGKYFNLLIFDPAIGILGGLIIARWAFNLLKCSSKILLDFE